MHVKVFDQRGNEDGWGLEEKEWRKRVRARQERESEAKNRSKKILSLTDFGKVEEGCVNSHCSLRGLPRILMSIGCLTLF